MNHKHLKCQFSSKINFIHGPNGSGKSAIAVALMTCLGAKARDTNRASSLSSLVQTGKECVH
jgi:chromosome segregation ATPase